MNHHQLIDLLARFMDGATTVEEETRLANFFRTATEADRPDAVSAADWQAYGELFRMFDAAPVAQTQKPRRIALRWTAVAAASVAVLLIGALTLWHHPADEATPLTQVAQPVSETMADTVAVDKHAPADSTAVPPVKPRKRKMRRLQSMPPVPKTYLAETTGSKATEAADAAELSDYGISQQDLEEAMRQADRLLQAMQLQQEAAFGDAQSEFLQAMDALDTDDEEYIEQ